MQTPQISWTDSVSSTNDLAWQALRTGTESVLFCAAEQTKGRGRSGNEWLSRPGLGLYASMALTQSGGLRWMTVLPFMAGVAVIDALSAYLDSSLADRRQVGSGQDCTAQLKWPNDLLLLGKDRLPRKWGGILVESQGTGTLPDAVVIGIGLNLLHSRDDLPAQADYPATSLSLCLGSAPSPRDFAPYLADALLSRWRMLCAGQLPEIWNSFRKSWYDVGQIVHICEKTTAGELEIQVTGTVVDIEPDGTLHLRTKNGIERIRNGSLRYAKS